jgi:hypothetical protein
MERQIYSRFAVDISDIHGKLGPALTDAISSLTSAITSVLNSAINEKDNFHNRQKVLAQEHDIAKR